MKTSNYIKLENILPVIAFALILVLVGSLVYGIISGLVCLFKELFNLLNL